MASDLTQKDSLRVGLIVESTRVSSYIVDLAKWGQTQNNLQVSHLIIQQTRMPSVSDLATIFFSRKRKNVREMLNLFSFSLIARFENIRLRNRQEIHKEHLRSYRVQDVVPESISIVPIAPQDDGVFRLSSADIEKLKSLDLNLLITYGPRIFHGEILNTSTFGLITLHHTDQKENTGEPAGFWEVFFRQDATGFTIEHLSEGKSSGDVLYRGHFQTQPYFLLNQACLYRKSNFFLQQIVSEIAEKGELPDALEKTPRSHRGFTHPNLGVQLIYVFRHVFDFIRKGEFNSQVQLDLSVRGQAAVASVACL